MSKAPAMPMYWDAYLADTTHLTTEEHGAYMLLLAAMWRRNGSVPDDDKDNARILGLTKAKWLKIKARLTATISGFNADGDTITQEKLRKTWENTQEKIAKNAANGAKGGRAAARKTNDLGQANANKTLKPKATIPEPEPEPDSSVPKGTAADAPRDLKKVAFDEGVKLLRQGGRAEGQARGIIGKWVKSHGEAEVVTALGKAQREGAIDPVSFCEGVFKHQGRNVAPAGFVSQGAFGTIPERN